MEIQESLHYLHVCLARHQPVANLLAKCVQWKPATVGQSENDEMLVVITYHKQQMRSFGLLLTTVWLPATFSSKLLLLGARGLEPRLSVLFEGLKIGESVKEAHWLQQPLLDVTARQKAEMGR